ncbi:THAP-type domain-containing protein, partial [Aphis craccivora]
KSSKKHCLKKTAVLSCNLPKCKQFKSTDEISLIARSERSEKRNKITSAKCHLSFEEQDFNNDTSNNINNNIILNNNSIIDQCTSTANISLLKDAQVQVTSGDLSFSFTALIDTDQKLNTLTGLHSFVLLDSIIESLNLLEPIPFNSNKIFSLRDCVIMTFIKLKQNMSYSVLAVLFKCSILKPMIPWPSKNEILCNMPKCFNNFKNTRIVIDCIEIPIMKPKTLSASIITYSHYKSTYTAKFMTGVTPAGLLSFVSQGYGGRVSDKFIFENSLLINLLEEDDAIMADKGFLIDSVCAEKHIKLFRPPFLKGKQQFSSTEALLNKSIASARVHIERVNQRIKIFSILNKFPSSLTSKVDEIFFIICAIVNLSVPILAIDKF